MEVSLRLPDWLGARPNWNLIGLTLTCVSFFFFSCGKAGHVARNCPSGAWSRLRADNAAERDTERSADPTSAEAQYLGASVSGLPSRATSAYTEGVAEMVWVLLCLLPLLWLLGQWTLLLLLMWQ